VHYTISRRRFAEGLLASIALPVRRLIGASRQADRVSRSVPVTPRAVAWKPSARLVAELPGLMEQAAVPGMQLVVIEDGEIAWQESFGLVSAGDVLPVTGDTLFEGASLCKPIFAYGALKLVLEGCLDLDTPLVQYDDTLDSTGPYATLVTPRHVLSHTTGLTNWRSTLEPLRIDKVPGNTFSYSGEAFFLLQRVVESVTDLPTEVFMQETVFRPLGMKSTTLAWAPTPAAHLAHGHLGLTNPVVHDNYSVLAAKLNEVAERWSKPIAAWRYQDQVKAIDAAEAGWPVTPNYMMPNVAGSALTNATDVALFMIHMLRPDKQSTDSSDQLRELMLTPVSYLNRSLSWGLGWGLEAAANGKGPHFWHWGNNEVFRSFAIGDAQARRGLVVLTNSSNGHKLYQRIVPQLTGLDHPSLLWFRT